MRVGDEKWSPERSPIVFPLACIRKFGGQAVITRTSHMTGILGVSGGFKTTLLYLLADNFNRLGTSSLWWGPEWDEQEMVEMLMQRYAGVSMTAMLEDELYSYDKFVVGEARPMGQPLSAQQRDSIKGSIMQIRKWAGKMMFLNNPMMTVDEFGETIFALVQEIRPRPRVVFIDYLNMLYANGIAAHDRDGMFNTMQRLKTYCLAADIHAIVAAQTTKDASRSVDEIGNVRSLLINVAKNSRGSTGLMRVNIDVASGRIIDKPATDQDFEFSTPLGMDAGRHVHAAPFNLMLTITPEYSQL